ncbi:GLUCOSAMINE--FRUCTOSE-6-PHOSPHATE AMINOTRANSFERASE, ISOMERIZING [Ceraceosorus bombacis]|uniref:GLUCOSAMINE--FRUCTOSE-6-PHOSPHATE AMINOTRANSFERASE, ISOMERIZING n=1 Tax=Ceraceosorus bombacis TaxID=401625 RepID=A0A0P1B9A9_9BASI|nr:GLUCOSAMINE--FRUCTOSE-6-PHOSPHATE AMINOTRANSFERASE, ISOMERIZING [Ceraceosorus bombacis]
MLAATAYPVPSSSRLGLVSTDGSAMRHESASSSGWSSPMFKASDLDLFDVDTRFGRELSIDETIEIDDADGRFDARLDGQMTPPSTAPPSAYSASCFGVGNKHATLAPPRHHGHRVPAAAHYAKSDALVGAAASSRYHAISVVDHAGVDAADESPNSPDESSPLSSASNSDLEGENSEDELGIDLPAATQHAQSVLLAEAKALMEAASRLQTQPSEFEKAIKTVVNCVAGGGKIVWTGVGKSGIIARKLHASSLSLGLSSAWLCPISALHGDLGTLSGHWPQAPRPPLLRARMAEHRAPLAPVPDVLCALSHSGESAELLNLLPHAQARGCPIVAFTSKNESSLAKAAKITRGAWVDCRTASPMVNAGTNSTAALEFPSQTTGSHATTACARSDSTHCACCPNGSYDASTSPINTSAEADALVPAPTSSTTVALAMGDSLVLSVARASQQSTAPPQFFRARPNPFFFTTLTTSSLAIGYH